jgi:hypothetical protein
MLAVDLDDGGVRSRRKEKAAFRHSGCAVGMIVVCGCALVTFLNQAQEASVLTNIQGIDDVTKGFIDSGEWSKEAIIIDQEKGLLPPDPSDSGAGGDGLGGGSPDDAKRKKRGNSAANSSNGPGGLNGTNNGLYDNSINGHCKKDVHIKCASHADCGPLGGCVQWHCSNNPEAKCLTSDDCAPDGGICTGAGYCKANPETACSKTRDCQIYEDAQCLYGGTCQLNSQVACIQDSDCSQEGDSCSFHINKWWEAGTDFPRDETEAGPYANWTEAQLRKKMIAAMKKILYLQSDMETQIPINRMLNQSIAKLTRRKGEILKVNVPYIRRAQKKMRKSIESAAKSYGKDSTGSDLGEMVEDMNRTIVAKDSIQDDHVMRIKEDFDFINETVNSSYTILLSRMENLWQEFNDTVVELNETQHNTTKMLLEYFRVTFQHAKSELLSSLKEIEEMPTQDYYKGLRDVERMFRDFKVKNERYLRKIYNDVLGGTQKFSDQSAMIRDANSSYYNNTNRASVLTDLSKMIILSQNVSAQETNLTALERALLTFERDHPLPTV